MTVTVDHPVASVPKMFPGGTIAILASGPSMTQADADYVRGRADAVIAINDTYKLAMWADMLYGSDATKFWQLRNGAPEFPGLKYSAWTEDRKRQMSERVGVPSLRATGDSGLDLNPSCVRTGKNSAYAAINVAVHLGAKRIVLLGVDMKHGKKGKRHWHEDYSNWPGPALWICPPLFDTLVEPLKAIGVEVWNCTRDTALRSFPCQPLESVL